MPEIESHIEGPSLASPSSSETGIENRDSGSSEEEQLEPLSMREILIGGTGFLIFLSLMVAGMNAIGVEQLQQAIRDAGPAAPLIYIALKALTYIFAPLTSGPIQIMAAPLFGHVIPGTLYTLMGEVIGGSINFWIARHSGRPIVLRLVGQKGMMQVETFYQKRMGGWISLVLARLILFSVWDFLSYAAGLAKSVRFSSYLLVSIIIGVIPTFFFVWIGNEAIQDTQTLLMIYGLVALMIIIPVVARHQIAVLFTWASRKNGRVE